MSVAKNRPVKSLLAASLAISMCFAPLPAVVWAEEADTAATRPTEIDAAKYDQAVNRGVRYLMNQGQRPDGSFSSQSGIGITSICTLGMLRHGRSVQDPAVEKAMDYLKTFIREDGGIYTEGTVFKNYETSLGVLVFAEANTDGRYDDVLKGADAFLKGIQWDEGEGKSKDDPAYGGAGYGTHSRPDLSNTNFLIEALKATGNGPEDEAMQKALIFVSRCQNLESEHNQFEFAQKNSDGGFYYTIAAGGSSQAGELPNGALRSYGSMTYAGLKSMIYAGVEKDDPRVVAAIGWLSKNYSLEQNPGMGDAGLFYYYHTFAKALDAYGEDAFEAEDGTKHNWRAELAAELIERQAEDGSWANKNQRWLEGDANLVTGYALLAMSYLRPMEDK